MMRRSFGEILIGLLLVSFDFRLGLNSIVIHLLPDFLGYALIAIAAKRLLPHSPRFRVTSLLGWVLTFASIIGYFLPPWKLWYALTVTLLCLLVWFLLSGMIDIAGQRGRERIVQLTSIVRVSYVILRMAPLLLGRFLGPLNFLTTIAFWVVLAMLLYLVIQMRREPDLATDV